MIIGTEGKTITVNLRGRVADAIDLVPIERGDLVSIKNVLIGSDVHVLDSIQTTLLEKVKQSKIAAIRDYSLIKEEMKNVDLAGILVEVGAVKIVKSMFGSKEVEVCEGIVSDTKISARVSFWGSSARATRRIVAGSWIKLEFVAVRNVGDAIFVNVSDSSRICKCKKPQG